MQTVQRGHWPAGRRRHAGVGRRRVGVIRRWLHRVSSGGEPGLSLRGVARALRVNDRTVRRWMSGEHWPSPEHADALDRLRVGDPKLIRRSRV